MTFVRASLRSFGSGMALLVVLAAFLPVWMGPLLAPVAVALGAGAHVCACGMKAGTCGCPECEEKERAEKEDARGPHPVVKPGCHTEEVAPGAPIPPFVQPASEIARIAVAGATRAAPTPVRSFAPQRVPEPATPPPKRVT